MKKVKAEAMLVTAFTNHNIPETFYDCLVPLLKAAITDSEIVKSLEMSRTKGGYMLTEGVGPHYHLIIVAFMKSSTFL